MEVRRILSDEWRQLKALRLRALADSPDAFGSTLDETRRRPDEYWRTRSAETAGSDTSALFVASEDGAWLGLAGGAVEPEHIDHVELTSLWVEPAHRRAGIATSLCGAVEDWARLAGARRLRLWVTSTNQPALRLYARLGFTRTEQSAPLPSNPELREVLLIRDL